MKYLLTAVSMVLAQFSFAATAPSVVAGTDVSGGLVVWLGCSGTDDLVQLGKHPRFLTQVLDTDPRRIRQLQDILEDKGVSRRVWVSRFDGKRLPFADNTVNLVVAIHGTSVSQAEIMRILAPRGVAKVGKRVAQRPVPDNIDEWTHHLHAADGNAVARDQVVGPPRHLQWAAKPLWSKHHHALANVNAMVSTKGRVFAICEESPVSVDPGMMPDQWNLVARDAFNGVLLWRLPIKLWGTKAWNPAHPHGRNNQPTHIGRRLVAVGDRVYVTLGYNSPVSEIDAATGRVVRVLEGTAHTDAILCKGDRLILTINNGPQAAGTAPPVSKSVAVLDRKTGKALWKKGDYVGLQSKTKDMDRINHLTMAVGTDRLFFFGSRKELVCLSLKDGQILWTRPRPMAKVHEMRYNLRVTDRCSLVAHDDVLLMAQPEPVGRFGHLKGHAKIYAFSTKTGEALWDRPIAQWGWAEPPDVFVINGEVWVFDLKAFSLLALDPKTGKELRRWNTAEALDKGHHHRCYRNRAAERFVLTSHRGIELFDLKSGKNSMNPFVRGACQFGFLPCNGLLYATPHPCGCFIDGKLNGILALAPRSENRPVPSEPKGRLIRGPAFGKVKRAGSASAPWPTYRADMRRSGSTSQELPLKLKPVWQAQVTGEPTACVIGEGKVLVASKSTRRLHALDEKTGARVWDRVMNGAADSPPTIHNGTALLGTRDGYVTCLRLTDGEVVWRFKAALNDRWLHVYGGVESASPVSGSILVKDGTAYFAAGRSSYLDGGIHVYALDAGTGELKSEKTLATVDESKVACLADILVHSGDSIFMRDRSVFGPVKASKDFVFSRSSLLDEAWFNRAPWSLGRETQGATYGFWNGGGKGQNMEPLSGQYLVHDASHVYTVVSASSHRDQGIFKPGRTGYRLTCAKTTSKRRSKPVWQLQVPVRIMAMVNASNALFAMGTPDIVDKDDPWAALEGRKGGRFLVLSKKDGKTLSGEMLPAAPVLDGLAAANGHLFMVLKNGQVRRLGAK